MFRNAGNGSGGGGVAGVSILRSGVVGVVGVVCAVLLLLCANTHTAHAQATRVPDHGVVVGWWHGEYYGGGGAFCWKDDTATYCGVELPWPEVEDTSIILASSDDETTWSGQEPKVGEYGTLTCLPWTDEHGVACSWATEQTATAGPAIPRIKVNSATTAELDALPGIGPVLAGRIIEAREGAPFVDCGDLEVRVKGIGPKTAAKVCPLVTF